MTRHEANRLLDGVRAGVDVDTRTIRRALLATGDLSGWTVTPKGRDGWVPRLPRPTTRARVFEAA